MNIASLILKLCGLALVILAAGLWTGAGVQAHTNIRDEQALVSGAIWSQILIPIGLIISAIVDERLDNFVHAYYLFAGWVILGITGALLVVVQCKNLKKQRRRTISFRTPAEYSTQSIHLPDFFDKVYFGIGVLMCLAATLTFADFILNIIIE